MSSNKNVNFDNEFIYRFGGELEMILPFNNNKWAIIIEPSYQSYSGETIRYNSESFLSDVKIEATYNSLEIPFGVRHYFFLNDESKIFVNAFYTLIYTKDSDIKFNDETGLEIEKAAGQSIGLGYSNKKLSAECRYEFTRDILSTYSYWFSDYNQVSLIFGYQLF